MTTLIRPFTLLGALVLAPAAAWSDAFVECSLSNDSQTETAACVAAVERTVDQAVEMALGFARERAAGLDEITGRPESVPALERAQAAWSAWRDAQCEFIGSSFGGGSGTGIAIQSCRIDLARDRVDALMRVLH
jgi:uncharacterized protein YecT (DUF1311 family)